MRTQGPGLVDREPGCTAVRLPVTEIATPKDPGKGRSSPDQPSIKTRPTAFSWDCDASATLGHAVGTFCGDRSARTRHHRPADASGATPMTGLARRLSVRSSCLNLTLHWRSRLTLVRRGRPDATPKTLGRSGGPVRSLGRGSSPAGARSALRADRSRRDLGGVSPSSRASARGGDPPPRRSPAPCALRSRDAGGTGPVRGQPSATSGTSGDPERVVASRLLSRRPPAEPPEVREGQRALGARAELGVT